MAVRRARAGGQSLQHSQSLSWSGAVLTNRLRTEREVSLVMRELATDASGGACGGGGTAVGGVADEV